MSPAHSFRLGTYQLALLYAYCLICTGTPSDGAEASWPHDQHIPEYVRDFSLGQLYSLLNRDSYPYRIYDEQSMSNCRRASRHPYKTQTLLSSMPMHLYPADFLDPPLLKDCL